MASVRRAAENVLCLVLLAAIGVLARYPILLTDAIPADLDALYSFQPWEELQSNDARPSTPESVDSLRYYAWYSFLHDSAASNDSLLWNPDVLCGVPFAALWETRVYSPFSLPFYFFPVPRALQLSLLLKLVVAGWAAFYAARRFGLAAAPAFLVGVAFEISSTFLTSNVPPLSDTLPWTPLLFLFVDSLACGRYRSWPFGALVLTLMLTGGDGVAAASMVAFGLLFLLLHDGRPRRWRLLLSSTGALAASATFALLLFAVQLVPYVEWLQQAAPLTTAQPLPDSVISDVFALLFPTSADPWYPGLLGLSIIGITQILLLGLWLAVRFAVSPVLRRRVESLLLTAALFTLAGFAVAPYLRAHLQPRHLFLANSFVIALVSAAAVQVWVQLNAAECKRAIKRLLSLLIACTAATGAAMAHKGLPLAPDVAIAVTLLALFLALLIVTVIRPSTRIAAYGAGALVAAELLVSYLPRAGYVASQAFFPATEFTRRLAEDGGRVGGGPAMEAWPLGVYGVAQMRGPAIAMPARYRAFGDRLHHDPMLIRRTAARSLLLTKPDIQGTFAMARASLRVRHVLPAGAVLFEDLNVKSRAWVTREWVPAPEGAPDKIASETAPVIETAIAPPPATPDESDDLVSVHSTNGHVSIQAKLEQPGILVLADTFYPGWKAAIDGKHAPVLAVDSLFRGIEVPAGTHIVEFAYRPESFRLGLIITCVAAGALIMATVRFPASTLRRNQLHA